MAEVTGQQPSSPAPRSVGRNVVALFSSQLATWVLSAVMLVVMPRFLGPVALGQLRVSTSLWAIVSVVAVFGTGSLVTIEIAKRHDQARPLVRSVMQLRTGVFLVMLPLVAVYVALAGYQRGLIVVVALGTIGALFGLIYNVDRSALLATEQMGIAGSIDVVAEVLTVVAVVGVLVAGAGVVVIASVMSGAAVVTAVLFRRSARRSLGTPGGEPLLAGRSLMKASSPFFFADAMVIIYLQIDTLVISLIATEREVGWYSTADSIFGSLLFVPAVLLTAIFPRIARMHHEKPEEIAPLLVQAFSTMMAIGFWIGIGTVVVSKSFTETLFGPEFRGSAAVLAIFGFVAILGHQTIVLAQFAVATGRARFIGTLMLVATVASIPLDLVLVRWSHNRYGNGAIGAGLAYIVTEGVQIGVGIAVYARNLLCRSVGMRFVRCLIAGGAMLGVGWPLRSAPFFLSGAAASVTYFAVQALLRTPDEFERDAIRTVVTRIRRR